MLIRVGFEIAFTFPESTSMVLMLSLHPSLDSQVRSLEKLRVTPEVPISSYLDLYGNRCSRVSVAAGRSTFSKDVVVDVDSSPDVLGWNSSQHTPPELPNEVLVYLLASRYC
jgi:hypothetical protein